MGASLAGEVALWITLNEPWCSAWLGYGSGIHAPGKDDVALAWAATHHLLLGHGLAMQAMSGAGQVGIALNLQPTRPATYGPADVRAARLADLQMNALYLDPLFGRGYPADLVEYYADESDPTFVHHGRSRDDRRPDRLPRRELLPTLHRGGRSRRPVRRNCREPSAHGP